MKIVRTLLLILMVSALSNTAVAQTVYITKTGHKYHKSTCRYIKKSGRATTLQNAIDLNYDACKVCRPRKSAKKVHPKSTHSRQCSGQTKAGNRCKRKTRNANGRCYQH